MHASRLVELAAFAANQHQFVVRQLVDAEFWGADQFWVLTRARANEWSRKMKACQQLRTYDKDFDPQQFWKSTEPVLEEVFLSEVSTRVWCASLAAVDHDRLHGELDPIARSVFVSNLECRRRALRLLLFARGLPDISTTSLNMLRRDCETWTDTMLARFSHVRISRQFCFERDRVQELAKKLRHTGRSKRNSDSYSASMVVLRYMLATRSSKPAVCAELNQEIAAMILGCLPATSFDGSGAPIAPWILGGSSGDALSIDVLADLCGSCSIPRLDIRGGLKDSR